MSKTRNSHPSKSMQRVLRGPIADILIALGGQGGSAFEKELMKFVEREPCWQQSGHLAHSRKLQPRPLLLKNYRFTVHEFFGLERTNWKVLREPHALEDVSREFLLDAVRFVPAVRMQPSVLQRRFLRDSQYTVLGEQAFVACWTLRHRLPQWWTSQRAIYCDGFTLQEPASQLVPLVECQHVVKMHYSSGTWAYSLERIHEMFRHTYDSCSAVYP